MAIQNGITYSVSFTVVEPTHLTAVKTKELEYPDGGFGVGMDISITAHPIDVSFSEVKVLEDPSPAINIKGYFTNYPLGVLDHKPNPLWGTLSAHNAYADTAALSQCPSPWSSGSYQWDIPVLWRVGDGNSKSLSTPVMQKMTIHSEDGNSSVEKLGCSATRCP